LQARPVLVAAVAIGAALVIVTQVVAAPTWQTSVRIAPAAGDVGGAYSAAFSPTVAVDSAGDAVVAWQWSLGTLPLIQTSSRRRGTDTWSGPVTLAEGASTPSIAIDAAGHGFVVFTKGGSVFQAAYRPDPDGTWQDPITVSSFPNTDGGGIAVNADGDAVVGFTRWSGTGYVAQAAVRPAASGVWQNVVDLSDPNGNSPRWPAVAIDADGNAVALWLRAGPVSENPVVQASFRPVRSASWDSPVELGGPYARAAWMHVGFDAAGDAVAVWEASTAGGGDAVYASFRPTHGSWQTPTTISYPSGLKRDVKLSVDAAGDAFASWISVFPETQAVVEAAVRHGSSGTWDAPIQLSPSSRYAYTADLAADQDGNAVLMWTEGLDGPTVHAALRPIASDAWTPPAALPPSGSSGEAFDVAVALDGKGNAVALWERSPSVVERSELRAGGPVLTRLDVPARGAVGVPVRFHVDPAPWGSPIVGVPNWNFGDGGSGRGKSVRHTYRRAGTHSVTVTAADATGATSTSSAAIFVSVVALANRTLPAIAGKPRPGETLTCAPGLWSGLRPIRFSFAWLRGKQATRASGRRYRIRAGDVGFALSCRVTATNATRSVSATSRPVRVRPR
jgi:hypothetical protein